MAVEPPYPDLVQIVRLIGEAGTHLAVAPSGETCA